MHRHRRRFGDRARHRLLFAREGARVAVADRRRDAAEAVAGEALRRRRDRAETDVSQDDAVKAMVAAAVRDVRPPRRARQQRRLRHLRHRRRHRRGGVGRADGRQRARRLPVLASTPSRRWPTNGGGAIVNTASVVAAVGIRNRAAYVASKGAVAALTRAIALDHVAEGIRCNAIAPGTIDTPYYDEYPPRARSSGGFRRGARGAPAARPARHRRGGRRRHPVPRLRREPLRDRLDPHDRRRHDGAVANPSSSGSQVAMRGKHEDHAPGAGCSSRHRAPPPGKCGPS